MIRWHRAGFRAYWRWKSRPRSGRPKTPLEIRQLIREISRANPLWGAPRIYGEILKLGIDVGQTTVAKYMAKGRRPPSQGKTFLHNHADGIASMDLFVVPTISFRLLYGLLILDHDRRQILWLGVTARHPARGFPRALRRTAYATAIITFASHEVNAPILTPDIPAMIAAATMVLIATQTPQPNLELTPTKSSFGRQSCIKNIRCAPAKVRGFVLGLGIGLTGCVTASSQDAPSRSSGPQFRSLR